jgi:hypothetical protein
LIKEGRISPPPVKAGDIPRRERNGQDPRRWLIARGFKVARDHAQITLEERSRVLELKAQGDKAEVIRRRLNRPRREVGDPEISVETIYLILRESKAKTSEPPPETPPKRAIPIPTDKAENVPTRPSRIRNEKLGEHALSALAGIGTYHAGLISYAALRALFTGLPKIPNWMR